MCAESNVKNRDNLIVKPVTSPRVDHISECGWTEPHHPRLDTYWWSRHQPEAYPGWVWGCLAASGLFRGKEKPLCAAKVWFELGMRSRQGYHQLLELSHRFRPAKQPQRSQTAELRWTWTYNYFKSKFCTVSLSYCCCKSRTGVWNVDSKLLFSKFRKGTCQLLSVWSLLADVYSVCCLFHGFFLVFFFNFL